METVAKQEPENFDALNAEALKVDPEARYLIVFHAHATQADTAALKARLAEIGAEHVVVIAIPNEVEVFQLH